MTDVLTTAILDQLGRVNAQGEALTRLLEKIERQIATRPTTPPLLTLAVDEPGDNRAIQPPTRQGAPLLTDRWGRLSTASAIIPSQAGPAFTFAVGGAGTTSEPIWIQGSDEGPVAGAIAPVDFTRNFLVYDTIPARAATDLFSWQVTPDRENWYTFTTFFGATVGVVAQFTTAVVGASRGVRLIQTAGAAGRWSFRTRMLGL